MPPYGIEWLDEARADVRALDRTTAMRLFEGTLHFARTGSGKVTTLHGDMAGAFRLRVGDYRSSSRSKRTSCASSVSAIALRLTVESTHEPNAGAPISSQALWLCDRAAVILPAINFTALCRAS